MTKRIFGGAFLVSLIAIISSVALVLGIAYNKEQQLFRSQLEQQAMLLAATMDNTRNWTWNPCKSAARISTAPLRTE